VPLRCIRHAQQASKLALLLEASVACRVELISRRLLSSGLQRFGLFPKRHVGKARFVTFEMYGARPASEYRRECSTRLSWWAVAVWGMRGPVLADTTDKCVLAPHNIFRYVRRRLGARILQRARSMGTRCQRFLPVAGRKPRTCDAGYHFDENIVKSLEFILFG
jgi:hypothetical protein